MGGVWPGGHVAEGNSSQVEAFTKSPAEDHLPEKAEGDVEKIGLSSSEKSTEEAVGKGSLLWFMISNDISFDLQYIDQDCIQGPRVQSSKNSLRRQTNKCPEDVCIADSELSRVECRHVPTSLLHLPVTFSEPRHWLLLNYEQDQLKFSFGNVLEALEAGIHRG